LGKSFLFSKKENSRMSESKPKNGSILIAKPFLGDPNFERTVVLICEYQEHGTFGLVLNQTTNLHLSDVLDDIYAGDIPLFIGGPVEQNTLHFVHRAGAIIPESVQLQEDLYWGGDFEVVKSLLNTGQLPAQDIRFFLGYSGWSPGQLDAEIEQDTWIVTECATPLLFDTPPGELWRTILRNMGGEYRIIANYPIDPRIN
jgi:putative transcriptional regulator